ncbi:MAG: hypothetical protein QM500_19485 [Methylococcales bacterium]
MQMKDRFLSAVISGEIGKEDGYGIVVTLREFKKYFSDVKSDYINSFLPAAVIETGQYHTSQTKYLFRVKKGIYRIHPDAINEYKNQSDNIKNDTEKHIRKDPIQFFSFRPANIQTQLEQSN